MQPSPIAETSRLLFPSLRFFMFGTSDFSALIFDFWLCSQPLVTPTRHVVAKAKMEASCEGGSTLNLSAHSDLREAMSIEKRYFTSDLSNLSYASLTFWMGITSTSAVMLFSPQKSSIS